MSYTRIIELERQRSHARLDPAQHPVVLVAQDTSEFNFSGRQLEELGVLSDNRAQGFLAHTALTVSVDGVPLGLADQQIWNRTPAPTGQPDTHKQRPINEKESFKWLVGLSRSVQSAPNQQIITVCDREGDIYELFASAHAQGAHFVVRMRHNRSTTAAQDVATLLAQQPPVTTYSLRVARRPQSAPEPATLALRFVTLTLRPPKRTAQSEFMPLIPLTVQVVEAVEVDPPAGEPPLHWRVVTNLPVTCAAEAQTVLRYYSYRWLVERFHFVLKSGYQIEASQLASFDALANHLALCSTVAWRILHLTHQARLTPEASCETHLPRPVWQALMAFTLRTPTPPPQPPTLRQAVRAIAKLGGFLGRKHDGEPGVKTIWRGLVRLDDIAATYSLFLPKDVGKE